MRYSLATKPRALSALRRPAALDDKERESLEALNSERQALMLKAAAREYAQPRLVHFGKIAHQPVDEPEDRKCDCFVSMCVRAQRACIIPMCLEDGGGGSKLPRGVNERWVIELEVQEGGDLVWRVGRYSGN